MVVLGKRIEKIRKELGLSQEEFSSAIGINRVALSKVENDDRKLTIDELKKISEISGKSTDEILNPELEAKVSIENKKSKENVEKNELRINVPQEKKKKFEQVLLYILSKIGSMPNVGETVIYKLLYFIDFDYYEKYEEQLIGATYFKNTHGPTPREFKKIVDEMEKEGKIEKVKSKYFNYEQKKYLPIVKSDLSLLSAEELNLINDIIRKHSDKSAREFSEYSHGDVPWLSAKIGENIEYESVFYRTPEYSVRKYEE